MINAIRQRFPEYPHSEVFHAWNAEQARHDPDRFLTTRIFSDIDRGHTPTPHHVSALAAAVGWTFEQVCRELGIDFAQMPRLQAALGIDQTYVDADRLSFAGTHEFPSALAPFFTTGLNAPLHELVADWVRVVGEAWSPDARYVTGHVGRSDNVAYPRLPSGAAVLIDRSDAQLRSAAGLYAVEHPNGCSIGLVSIHAGLVRVHSHRPDVSPVLEYPERHVSVHGRVTAVAGRVDRMYPPLRANLSQLLSEQRPLLTADRKRDLSTSALLRELVQRRRLTLGRFERKARVLRRLAGPHIKLSRSHMSGLMQNEDLAPRLGSLYALAAILLVNPRDLLAAYGVRIDTPTFATLSNEAGGPLSADTQARLAGVRAHEGIRQLEREGWNLAWLCSLAIPHGGSQRAYYLGDPGPYLAPLITSRAFIIVNRRQRRVLTHLRGRPVSTLADWERPVYLLQTTGPRRYVCGYVEDHGEALHLLPHPDGPTRKIQRFRQPEEAVLIGRVTHVATLAD